MNEMRFEVPISILCLVLVFICLPVAIGLLFFLYRRAQGIAKGELSGRQEKLHAK